MQNKLILFFNTQFVSAIDEEDGAVKRVDGLVELFEQ